MTQDNSNSAQPPESNPPSGETPAPAPAPKKKKKRRLILKIGAALLLLIVILIVLAPTILSTGIARNIVLGQINDMLNGKLDIKDWSFGWTSGIHIQGVALTDLNNSHLVSIADISTPLSLLKAATGHLDLGDVTISDLDFNAVRDRNGVLNLIQVLKPSNKPPNNQPAKLPNVTGVIHLKNITGTFEDKVQVLTVGLHPLDATITIKDINQPIQESVTLVTQLENGNLGTVKIDGTLSAIQNNLVDLDHVAAQQTIELGQVDLAPVTKVLQMHHLKLNVTGKVNGRITAIVNTMDNISTDGAMSVTGASASGDLLAGDTVGYKKIQIGQIKASRVAVAGQPTAIKLDLPISALPAATTQPDSIDVHVDVSQDAALQTVDVFQNIADHLLKGGSLPTAPLPINGGNGSITVMADVGVANLVSQLPHVMRLEQGTSLDSGRLTHTTTVTLGNNQALIATHTHLENFSGTNAGTPVKLDDSDADAEITAVGGAAPDVRNIKFTFSSALANVQGGGETLGKMKVQGSSDLNVVQRQIGQFIDLNALLHAPAGSKVSLSGTLAFDASTDGDLTAADSNVALHTDFSANNLAIAIPGRRPVNEPKFTATFAGNLHHTAAQFVQAVHDLTIAVESPAINFQAGGDVKLGGKFGATVPSFAISQGTIDLRLLQEEIGGLLSMFVPAPKADQQPTLIQRVADNSVRIASGTADITGQGRFDQTGFGFQKPLAIQVQPVDLTLVDELGTAQTCHLPADSLVISGNGAVSDQNVASVKDLTVTATVGDPQKPLFTAQLSVDARVALASPDSPTGTSKLDNGSNISVSRIELTHCQGNLSGLQTAFGPLMPMVITAPPAATQPSISDLIAHNLEVCSSGTLTASMTGTYDGTTFTLIKPLAVNIAGLTLRPQGSNASNFIFNNENISTNIRGSVAYAGGKLHANFQTLSLNVGDELKIQADPKAPVDVAVGPSGEFSAGGTIQLVNFDIPKLAAKLSILPLPPGRLASLQQITSGSVSGAIHLDHAAGPLGISADLSVSDLTAGNYLKNETIHLVAGATLAADMASVSNASLNIDSSFAKIALSNGQILLAVRQGDKLVPVGVFDELQSADVEMSQIDLAKVDGLLSLLQPAGAGPQITSGIATLKASVSRHGDTTTANVSNLLVHGLAIQSGSQPPYAWPNDITAQLMANVDTLADSTGSMPLMDQLAKVSVTTLTADLGITKISLSNQKPIEATGLGDHSKMAVQGGIVVDGDIAPAARLAEVFGGAAANSYPYKGHYHFEEALAKDAAQPRLRIQGGGAITQFQVLSGQTVAFSEDNIAINNGVAYDFDSNSILIDHSHPISIALQSTGAASVTLTGTVNDLMRQRQIADNDHITLQVNYDLAKLWTIVKPLLTPDQQQQVTDLVIAGKQQRTFTVSGSFPADQPINQAIALLNVGGYFTIDNVATHGLTIGNFDLPVSLKGGILRTVYPDKPEGANAPRPATCNDGTLDLGVLAVDLRGPAMILSMPGVDPAHPHTLLKNVSLNATMAKTIFADFLNNPAFANASNSRGLATVSILQCQNNPLSNLILQQSPQNQGIAHVQYSIKEMQLGSPLFALIGNESVSAEINNADVVVQNGRVTQDTTIMIDGNKPLRMAGVVILSSKQFAPMTAYIATALFGAKIPANARQYMPDQIVVPMEGDMNHPKMQIDKALGKAIQDAAGKAVQNGLLNGLLGGKKH